MNEETRHAARGVFKGVFVIVFEQPSGVVTQRNVRATCLCDVTTAASSMLAWSNLDRDNYSLMYLLK